MRPIKYFLMAKDVCPPNCCPVGSSKITNYDRITYTCVAQWGSGGSQGVLAIPNGVLTFQKGKL